MLMSTCATDPKLLTVSPVCFVNVELKALDTDREHPVLLGKIHDLSNSWSRIPTEKLKVI
jgi:hypothetical protein